MVGGILKQQKRSHATIDIDPYIDTPANRSDLCPGDRPDNRWHLFDDKTAPLTQEAWEKTTFVEKTHWGYYNWPRYSFTLFRTSVQISCFRFWWTIRFCFLFQSTEGLRTPREAAKTGSNCGRTVGKRKADLRAFLTTTVRGQIYQFLDT